MPAVAIAIEAVIVTPKAALDAVATLCAAANP